MELFPVSSVSERLGLVFGRAAEPSRDPVAHLLRRMDAPVDERLEHGGPEARSEGRTARKPSPLDADSVNGSEPVLPVERAPAAMRYCRDEDTAGSRRVDDRVGEPGDYALAHPP